MRYHVLPKFLGGSVATHPPINAEDTANAGLIPGSGRSLGGGHGNPLRYSCLENPMDRGAWRATVHGVAGESDTLSDELIWVKSKV